jgi:hypothetical protein
MLAIYTVTVNIYSIEIARKSWRQGDCSADVQGS